MNQSSIFYFCTISIISLFLTGCLYQQQEELTHYKKSEKHLQSTEKVKERTNRWLMHKLPRHWKVKVHGYAKESALLEATPEKQNIDQWQELITSQTYYQIKTTPEHFLLVWSEMLEKVCAGFIAEPLIPMAVSKNNKILYWRQFCPQAPKDQKPEFSLVKSVSDDNNIYILKRSWRYIPTQEQLEKAITWLDLAQITTCDNCLTSTK